MLLRHFHQVCSGLFGQGIFNHALQGLLSLKEGLNVYDLIHVKRYFGKTEICKDLV